jgi:hypothetical protein
MQRKHWIVITLVITLAVVLSGIALANTGATVTINVMWTEGRPVEGAFVTLYEDSGWGEVGDIVGGPEPTDENGDAVFSGVPAGAPYQVKAELPDYGPGGRETQSHFYLDEGDTEYHLTLYMLSDGDADVYFSVTGAVGIALYVEEGHHQTIGMGNTEFAPSRLRVEVHNIPDQDPRDVTITAFTLGEGWHGNLVWTAPAEAGKIAIQFSEDNGTYIWLTEAGQTLTLTDGEGYSQSFWIKGIVAEGTADVHGRIIFRASLTQ